LSRTASPAISARILAALVALGLSGVPALAVEALGQGRGATHRCHCPPGEHRCECPVCRSAVRSARQARVAELPPCHRARALEAFAEEEAQGEERAPAAAPCLRSSCDDTEARLPTPAGHEAFVVPARTALAQRGGATHVPAAGGASPWRALEPETPPPRCA
jgi:hypothetical protein